MSKHSFALKIKTGNPLNKLVLFTLIDYVDENGNCWASIPFLAEQCECCENTVRRKLHDLQKRGFIKIRPIEGHPNVITVLGYKEEFKKQSGGANHVCTH